MRKRKETFNEKIRELKGGNMDIDLLPNSNIDWKQDNCSWNVEDGENKHRCAVKNVSVCKYFKGVKKWDIVLCGYSKKKS